MAGKSNREVICQEDIGLQKSGRRFRNLIKIRDLHENDYCVATSFGDFL